MGVFGFYSIEKNILKFAGLSRWKAEGADHSYRAFFSVDLNSRT